MNQTIPDKHKPKKALQNDFSKTGLVHNASTVTFTNNNATESVVRVQPAGFIGRFSKKASPHSGLEKITGTTMRATPKPGNLGGPTNFLEDDSASAAGLTASNISALNMTGGFNLIECGALPPDMIPEANRTMCPLMSSPLRAVPDWRIVDGQKKKLKKVKKRNIMPNVGKTHHVLKLDIAKGEDQGNIRNPLLNEITESENGSEETLLHNETTDQLNITMFEKQHEDSSYLGQTTSDFKS